MKDGNAKRILELLRERPGLTRSDLMNALTLRTRQANNALWRLKDAGRIECDFAGRYSKWRAVEDRPSATKPVSSVWKLGITAPSAPHSAAN